MAVNVNWMGLGGVGDDGEVVRDLRKLSVARWARMTWATELGVLAPPKAREV